MKKITFKVFFLILTVMAILLISAGCQKSETAENKIDSIGFDTAFHDVFVELMAADGDQYWTEKGLVESDLKMRIYNGFFENKFIEGASLNEIIKDGSFGSEAYVMELNEKLYFLKRTRGKLSVIDEDDGLAIPFYWFDLFLENPQWPFALSDNDVIPKNVKIESAYFLTEPINNIQYIFYQTNKGEFVFLCRGFQEDSLIYLMPQNVFYEKIKDRESLPGYGSGEYVDFTFWLLEK